MLAKRTCGNEGQRTHTAVLTTGGRAAIFRQQSGKEALRRLCLKCDLTFTAHAGNTLSWHAPARMKSFSAA